MQDPLGLVPLGREGTGAAQIFQPFDSSNIWGAYNASNAPVKTPLLDSFGNNVNTGADKVHPNDRWWIKQAQDKYLNRKVELMAKTAKERRDLTPDEITELNDLKQETADRIGVAQRMLEWNEKQRTAIQNAPYAYSPDEIKKVETFHETPVDRRELMPMIQRIPDHNYVNWFESMGDASKKTGVSRTDAQGNAYSEDKVTFDEGKAREAFRTTVMPQLYNSATGRAFVDAQRANLIESDPNFTSYTPEKQAELAMKSAEEYYVNVKRNQVKQSRDVTTKAAKADGGGSSTVKTAEMVPLVSREYVVYDTKTGQRVTELIDPKTKKRRTAGVAKKSEGTGIKLVDVVTIPIVWNEATPAENRVFQFVSRGQPVVGTPQYLRKHKNSKGEWDKTYWLVVITPKDKDGEQQIKEIPFTGTVKDKLEKEFKVKIEDIESKYGDLKKKAEGLPKDNVEDLPGWDGMPPETQAVYRNAWNARYGATTAAPAKAAPKASKYIQQYGRK